MEGNLSAIGAGLACLGMAGAGIGVGSIASNYLAGAFRNPSAAGGLTGMFFVGLAFAEALGILSFLIAIILAVQ